MVNKTELLTIDDKVSAPAQVVYSTEPRTALGEDHRSYFVKGPDLEVVFAELAGCELGRSVGLRVPEVAACHFDDKMYAGSVAVEDCFRDITPFLAKTNRVANVRDLYNAVVVDVWLANRDRNLGNVVGKPISGSRLEYVFIDFEKSQALRPTPTVLSNMLDPRLFWPTGALGAALRNNSPLMPPADVLGTIAGITERSCSVILRSVEEAVGKEVSWLPDSIFALATRARDIQKLVEEVWRLK